jgi:hypothetical protein
VLSSGTSIESSESPIECPGTPIGSRRNTQISENDDELALSYLTLSRSAVFVSGKAEGDRSEIRGERDGFSWRRFPPVFEERSTNPLGLRQLPSDDDNDLSGEFIWGERIVWIHRG